MVRSWTRPLLLLVCAAVVPACSGGFLTLEVDARLLSADEVARIATLEVTVVHDGGSPSRFYRLDGELDDGMTSIAVRLGSRSGDAQFQVRGLDDTGAEVASGESTGAIERDTVVIVVLGSEPRTDSGLLDAGGDGGIDSGGTDSATPCMPGAIVCQGPELYECIGGMLVSQAACPAGCLSMPMPHCADVVPSNGLDPTWIGEATDPFDAGADAEVSYQFDTDTGEILAGGTVLRPAGPGLANGIGFHVVTQGMGEPDIGVWTFTWLALTAGELIDIVGANAAAIVVETTADIVGTIDIGARPSPGGGQNAPGPGGTRGGENGVNLGNGPGAGAGIGFGEGGAPLDIEDSGGGGAGYGAVGGDGGATPMLSMPPAGGATYGTFELVPLIGGSGGGGGVFGDGGGGGGALQLVAGESITVDGTITAPGGYGNLGDTRDSGGGGGSGGAIVLEAPMVLVAGGLAANGGGGGSGANQSAVDGLPGERGRPDGLPALGGVSTGPESGAGADSGAGTSCSGMSAAMAINGGGGGGACGRIRINTSSGSAVITGVLSPSVATGLITEGVLMVQ